MDDDNKASGEPLADRLSKIPRGKPLTAVEEIVRGGRELTSERFTREYLEAPSVKLARELYASPTTELAREYANSPAQQLAKQAALGLSPAFSVAETAHMETMRKMLEPATALTETLSDCLKSTKTG
ncbi:hypothetical protein [Komagataeibacter sp. FNDCR2]|uniref:hypothetical protein n=1 Tax=Komagataeibacter sp. FNDCR2 TaxID=2878682 RepID=UPI001E4105FF|nr:hypothetical protein [Komagataeibacter sp. FNDCR2]MCE2575277.1 hypothetical protein [Komagataeibacter sp. FNDCR2]